MSKKIFTEAPKIDQSSGRVYSTGTIIESDLFKLNVANAMKNMAIQDSGQVELERVEHIHFFRTFDSDGKKMIHCAPVAGHFHTIEYKEDPSGGAVQIISCSPPLRMGLTRVRGQQKVVPVPLNEDLEDFHTHDVEYLRSHKVEARSQNLKAAQIIGEEASKTSTIAGIQG